MPRAAFSEELESLRLQVEVMALHVGEALARARAVLATGDPDVAAQLIAADDAIDAMQVSLTEHCYGLLAREAPVAADLRLIVSVIRVLHELERIGDLAIRIAKAVDDQPLIAAHAPVFEVLLQLSDNVIGRFEAVRQGWSEASTEPLDVLETTDPLREFADPLVSQIMALDGTTAVRVALASMAVGRSLDRIGDHSQIMACRLRYLVTGDPVYLADEVSW
ncbi:MAG: PhoU domain-containing protein [Actinomycetota bacterium]